MESSNPCTVCSCLRFTVGKFQQLCGACSHRHKSTQLPTQLPRSPKREGSNESAISFKQKFKTNPVPLPKVEPKEESQVDLSPRKEMEKFDFASSNILASLDVMKQEFSRLSQKIRSNTSESDLEILRSKNLKLQRENAELQKQNEMNTEEIKKLKSSLAAG